MDPWLGVRSMEYYLAVPSNRRSSQRLALRIVAIVMQEERRTIGGHCTWEPESPDWKPEDAAMRMTIWVKGWMVYRRHSRPRTGWGGEGGMQVLEHHQ